MTSVWGIFLFFVITRIIPYVGNSIPTGYDAGLYLLGMKTFPHIPMWLASSYYSLFFFITYPLVKAGVHPENLLLSLAFIGQILLFKTLYLTVKRLAGKKTALAAVFLLTASAIQFRTYWYFYLKNVYAVSLLLLSLLFLGERSYKRATLWSIITGVMHLPTFLILYPVWVIVAVSERKKRSSIIISLIVIALSVTAFYYPVRQEIMRLITPVALSFIPSISQMKAEGGGTFYPLYINILLMILYLPLAFVGLVRIMKLKEKRYYPFAAAGSVFLLILLVRGVFYRRFFITGDLIAIVFAAIGLTIVKKFKIINYLALCIFICMYISQTSAPAVNGQFLDRVRSVGKDKTVAYILSTSPDDTNWLMGYTDKRIISHGFGGYDIYWNDTEWNNFFTSQDLFVRSALIMKLPPHTAIFITGKTAQLYSIITSSINPLRTDVKLIEW
jgi:hypothetical protein